MRKLIDLFSNPIYFQRTCQEGKKIRNQQIFLNEQFSKNWLFRLKTETPRNK